MFDGLLKFVADNSFVFFFVGMAFGKQLVPPTTWYRLIAGLNAHLRLVRRGRLRVTFRAVLMWLESHANPALRVHGLRVDLAWFQATSSWYCHYGLLVYAIEEEIEPLSPEILISPTVARSRYSFYSVSPNCL